MQRCPVDSSIDFQSNQELAPLLAVMNRSISIAYLLSVVIHTALFLYLPPSVFVDEQLSVSQTPLTVNVILRHLDTGDDARDRQAWGTQANDISNTSNTLKEKNTLDDEMKVAKLEHQAPSSETSVIGTTQKPSAPPSSEMLEDGMASFKVPIDISAEKYPLFPDNAPVLATFNPSDFRIPEDHYEAAMPAPEKKSMSPKQQKMLNKKFKKWAENFYRMKQADRQITWEYGGQDYTAIFQRLPARDDMHIGQVIVQVNTEEKGNRLSTEMRMKRLAFSNFAQFVDRWDPGVQIHNDELEGRFHSNSMIYLESSRDVKPQFHGRVTTASRGITLASSDGRIKRENIFLGGLETGVKRIVLPKYFPDFLEETTIGHDQMHHFDEDTRITFYPDGTYGWAPVDSPAPEQIHTVSDKPSYIIGAQKAKLHVKGVISGRILVYSPEKIIIEDDLTYAHGSDTVSETDDYLGLVSAKNVEIAHPDITGPGNLLINASIYAKRRFVVRRYNVEENAMLFIYGSLTAGSLSATEPRYRTKIQFDKRLENIRPPNFPVTNRYEIEAWDGMWEIESGT